MFLSKLLRKINNTMDFGTAGIKRFSHVTGLFLTLFLIFSASDKPLFAALSSVSLSVPSPTALSDGKGYFLASSTKYYDFTVRVSDPSDSVSSILLTIPTQSGNITITDSSPKTNGGSCVAAGGVSVTQTTTGTTNRVNVYRVIFGTSAAASSASNRSITAAATDIIGNTIIAAQNSYYGICSSFAVSGLTQSGVASDGLVFTTRKDGTEDFTVKGTIVYDIPGYTLESVSDAVTSSDIPSVTCSFGAYSVSATLSVSAFTATVPYSATLPSGKNSWIISGTFAGSPVSFLSALSLECNSVVVKTLTFSGGTGRGPTHTGDDLCANYYRKYGASGTSLTLTAEMAVNYGSGVLMHGDTVFTVKATNGTLTLYFPVTIPSGKSVITTVLPYNNATLTGFLVASNATDAWIYSVSSVASSSGFNLNQSGDGNIPAVSKIIYWDNCNAPGTVTEIPAVAVQPRATYITFSWTPLSYATPDEDFYEYRIHFRESGGQWKVWTADDPAAANLRWSAVKTLPASGLVVTTIPNLKIFTSYEYYITAADVFGNESNGGLPPATPQIVKTLPYSIDITLTDGITHYDPASFAADLNPAVRPLKETAVKVSLSITGAEELPETVRVWYTIGDINTSPDIVIVSAISTINSGAFLDPANPLLSEVASKTGPNVWVAYLPTTNAVIKAGNNVRFIVETVRNSVSAFSDSVAETPPNPNLAEWTFCITGAAKFTPYPVRILNNVINEKHPAAYPSYYLSDDAYVTITVYDIKGRPVVTLIDDAFRHGGVNIKENGWQGKNKAGNKCGIGLYHVHFKAKRVSDGKTILNEFKKLVISK
jgi:hypothetical protein